MTSTIRGVLAIALGQVVVAGCSQLATWSAPKAAPVAPAGTTTESSRLAFARLCERRGEARQAEQIYRNVLEKNPRSAGGGLAHHRLGVIAAEQGKFADAARCFQAAAQCAPASADLLSDMGYALYLEHRLAEAQRVLREALRQDPFHAAANNNLGLVVGQQGRLDESLTLFRRAGGEAEAQANLAYVLVQRGDFDEAEAHYSRALSLDATLRPAAQALVELAEHRQARHRRVPADGGGPGALAGAPPDPAAAQTSLRTIPSPVAPLVAGAPAAARGSVAR